MLEQPIIKFIYILSYLKEINKKILCLIVALRASLHSLRGAQGNKVDKNLFTIKRVNQQETLLSNFVSSYTNFINKGSSETTRDTTYNFNEYFNLTSKKKNKLNINFLEWFIGFSV